MKHLDYIMKNNSKERRNLRKKESLNNHKQSIVDLVNFSNGQVNIEQWNYLKVRKYFITFATNRSNFLNKQISSKISLRKKSINYTYQPKINDRSRKIVKTLHTKLNELKIPHYELLLYKGKEYEKRKEMNITEKKLRIKEEIKRNSNFHNRKASNCFHNSNSKVEDYDSMVVTRKPDAFHDYLDPKIYDSWSSSPSKSIKENSESGAFGNLSNRNDPQLDTTNLFDTSPILEEDYSESVDHSQGSPEDRKSKEEIKNSSPGHREYPILYVDINLGKDRVERLTVFEGENPQEVSENFAERTGINDKMKLKLENMLREQLSSILSRINEEEDEENH